MGAHHGATPIVDTTNRNKSIIPLRLSTIKDSSKSFHVCGDHIVDSAPSSLIAVVRYSSAAYSLGPFA